MSITKILGERVQPPRRATLAAPRVERYDNSMRLTDGISTAIGLSIENQDAARLTAENAMF